jgi:hypothetical protein
MRIVLLVFLYMLSGCGIFQKHKPTEPEASEDLLRLKEMTRVVKARYLKVSDPKTHWPSNQDCDGVLFAGVSRSAGVKEVRIDLADHQDGSIGRRPSTEKPCWHGEDQGSKSVTSQDMAQGRLFAFWRDRDLQGLLRFTRYGEAHRIDIWGLPNWILGEPYPEEAERVLLRPGMVGLTGRMLEKLSHGGEKRKYSDLPNVFTDKGKDYEEALTVRGIALFGEIDGQIDGVMYDVLKTLAKRRPKDWLFQSVLSRYSGDYRPVYETLLKSPIECPSYTRGIEANCLGHWLFASSLLLGSVEVY